MRAIPARWSAAGCAGLVACSLLILWQGSSAPTAEPFVQFRGRVLDEPAEADSGDSSVLVVADRRLIQRLRAASDQIADGNYLVAIEHLQRLVEVPEDAFYHPDSGQPGHFRSLKTAAEHLIGAIPLQGRQLYERQYGATAQGLLAEAVRSGDAMQLADVARRFYHTAAGAEATYRLAIMHFDQGRPLEAALCFERLRGHSLGAERWEPGLSLRAAVAWRKAGMADSAEAALRRLADRQAEGTIALAGHTVALGGEPAGEWWSGGVVSGAKAGPLTTHHTPLTTQWSVYLGNAARNPAVVRPAIVDQPEFSIPVMVDPRRDPADTEATTLGRQLNERVRDRYLAYGSRHRTVLPRMFPVIVEGTIAFRTFGDITFFNPRTGDWSKSLIDLDLEPLLDKAEADGGVSEELARLVGQRLGQDLAFGTLSSDGQFVYCVEDLGDAWIERDRRSGEPRDPPRAFNRLAAYDPRDGKLVWDVGGDPRDPFFVLPLAGTFFLGPPLPLGGHLYCLADVDGEVRLLVLESALDDGRPTARLLWDQPLAVVPGSALAVTHDRERRLAGATVSYADGVFVCPTGIGALVAVDGTTRALLWARRFHPENYEPVGPDFGRRRRVRLEPARSGWMESIAIIAERRILFTPEYSDNLYCLDLLDGSVVWEKPRGESLFVAGVRKGTVLLVGEREIIARKLADDGEPAWSEPIPIPRPSGRGVIVDDRLYVPLSSAELAVVDIAGGKLLGRVKTPSGCVPGNLILAGGLLISQGLEAIETLSIPEVDESISAPAN
jgi:outer membrane protein assembly factor BamB